MRHLRAVLLTMLTLLPLQGGAWEPFQPDVSQEAFQGGAGPVDHLEPYVQTRKPEYYLAEFGAHPSFSMAFEWQLYLKGKKHVLRSWSLSRDQGGNAQVDEKTVAETEVPVELATVIYEIWTNALLETRYSHEFSGGLDGTSYRFSTYVRAIGWMHGRTWSPDGDLPPKWLVTCGTLVHEYARAADRNPARLTSQLAEYRKRLYSYWHQHGRH